MRQEEIYEISPLPRAAPSPLFLRLIALLSGEGQVNGDLQICAAAVSMFEDGKVRGEPTGLTILDCNPRTVGRDPGRGDRKRVHVTQTNRA